jgi:hypothetical protein
LKFILERTTGVRKSTIETLFNKLTEPFSDNYVVDFQEFKSKTNFGECTYSNLPTNFCKNFIGRETHIKTVLNLIYFDKIHPYITVIRGNSGVGKTTLVIKIANDIIGDKTPLLAYQAIIYIEFNKIFENINNNSALLEDEAINHIFRVFSEVFHDMSIVNIRPEKREEKIYKVLEQQRTLIIIDNFHNIKDNGRVKVSNFLAGLPISTKVILTTQESISMGYEVELKDMNVDEAKNLTKILINQRRTNLNFDFSHMDYLVNPLANNLAVNFLTIENEEKMMAISCPADSNQLDCWLREILSSYIDEESFTMLISIALFDSISDDSLFLISGIAKSTKMQILVSRWINLGIIYKKVENEKNKYFMRSGVEDYILKTVLHQDKAEKIKLIFDNAFKYYSELTKKYGGTDWGNWKEPYGRIEDEWLNIKLVLIHFLNRGNFNGYTQIKEIWDNVNHFADMFGYYSDRLKWLDWIKLRSKENKKWKDYSKCLSRSAWTLYVLGGRKNLKEAVDFLNEAMEISKNELEDNLDTKFHNLNILHHHTKILLKDNKYIEAEKKLNEKKEIINGINEENLNEDEFKLFVRCKMNYLRDLAQYYKKQKSNAEAEKYYKEVLIMSEEYDWPRGTALAANNLAEIEIDNGNLSEAESYLFHAIEIADYNDYKRRQARCNLSYARLEYKYKNKEKARKYAYLALDYYERFEREDKIKTIKEILAKIEELRSL